MKYQLVALWAICGLAHAEGPLIGFEFEAERNNGSGIRNNAVDIVPGWEFSEKSPISRVELLIERNRDNRADGDGITAKENKLFVRIRHDGDINDSLGYYIRGGVGRSFNQERDFNFAYVEPGIEYKFAPRWGWTLAFRDVDSIDAVGGQHVRKLLTGPSLDLDERNELEVRYIRGRGDEDLTAWAVEYVHKF